MQNGNTIAFFSRKLSSAQVKYPTVDKETICIVEVFKDCFHLSDRNRMTKKITTIAKVKNMKTQNIVFFFGLFLGRNDSFDVL